MGNDRRRRRRWLRLRRDPLDDLEDELGFLRDPQTDRVPVLLRLAVRLLPADVREEVLGDLLELWRPKVRHRPWSRRVLWLFRQPLAAAISRLRFGRRGRKGIGLASAGRLGVNDLLQDLVHTLRSLSRSPAFTTASVITLALALGANVAVFTIVNAVLLRPLPYADSDRIVTVRHHAPGLDLPQLETSAGLIAHYRESARSLTHGRDRHARPQP